jgi:hypothetical protein
VQRTGVGPDIELVAAPAASAPAARREADRAVALPGTDEPPPPKARVDETRCARPAKEADPALSCALAFLDAGALETFLVALKPPEALTAQ